MSEIQLQDPPCKVRLVRSARARRFTLRLGLPGHAPVLTLPSETDIRSAECFLEANRDWLRRALDRQPARTLIKDGTMIPIEGKLVRIRVVDGKRSPPELEDDHLTLRGVGAEGARVAAWLRTRARDLLLPAARSYARQLGKRVESITLRDTTSRWGSCSSRGALSFSWRLAMAPRHVLEYVAAHEAAHLREMNHSKRFWSLVDELRPGFDVSRDWLRREGRTLHAYDFKN